MRPAVFDAHIDTLLKISGSDSFLSGCESIQFDEPRALSAGVSQAVTAICAEAAVEPMHALARGLELFEELSQHSEIELLLMLEGCQPLVELQDRSDLIVQLSFASLTWNGENSLGGGIGSDNGLTKAGLELAEELRGSNVKLDVSHLGDLSRADLLSTGMEVVATHCNCRELHDCPRNLPDEDIVMIARSGGVIGITLVPDFLGVGATLETVADHLEHVVNLAGIEHAGFGSDFDGTRDLPEGVDDCTFWWSMFQLLDRRGWDRNSINAVAGDNWRRIMKEK